MSTMALVPVPGKQTKRCRIVSFFKTYSTDPTNNVQHLVDYNFRDYRSLSERSENSSLNLRTWEVFSPRSCETQRLLSTEKQVRKGKELVIILNLKGCIPASGTDTKEPCVSLQHLNSFLFLLPN